MVTYHYARNYYQTPAGNSEVRPGSVLCQQFSGLAVLLESPGKLYKMLMPEPQPQGV